MTRTAGSLFVAFVVAASSLSAHHSYSSYDVVPTEVEGIIERILWANPHVQLMIVTENRTYTVEWSSASALPRRGVTREMVAVGDRVIVTGRPHDDVESNGLILLQAIRRPADGWQWPVPDSRQPPAPLFP